MSVAAILSRLICCQLMTYQPDPNTQIQRQHLVQVFHSKKQHYMIFLGFFSILSIFPLTDNARLSTVVCLCSNVLYANIILD